MITNPDFLCDIIVTIFSIRHNRDLPHQDISDERHENNSLGKNVIRLELNADGDSKEFGQGHVSTPALE